jgi:hypothetical protein
MQNIRGSEPPEAPGQLMKEEWSKINQLLSYQPGEDILNASNREAPDMVQMSLDVNIRQGSARVLDSNNMEISCGTFENLQVGIQVYPKILACDGRLQFYGLSAPEGMLIEVFFSLIEVFLSLIFRVCTPELQKFVWSSCIKIKKFIIIILK